MIYIHCNTYIYAHSHLLVQILHLAPCVIEVLHGRADAVVGAFEFALQLLVALYTRSLR